MRAVASRMYAVSVAGVVVAAGLCMVAIARAVTVEPVETQRSEVPGVVSGAELGADRPVARVPSEGVLGTDALTLAVDRDPFMPDRRRAEPYRLPDERFTRRIEVREEEPVEPPPFRIIGTASAGSRSMALVQPLESGEIDMVLVGRDFQGYRLDSVDDESATLVMRDRTFRLGIQEGMTAGPGGGMDEMRMEDGLRRLRDALRERGMSDERIRQFIEANGNNVFTVDGQTFRFNNGSVSLPAEREVRLFGVEEPAPMRLPFGRAGRGGRARADTLSVQPG